MEEVQGERFGSRRYFYEGYVYHLDIRVATADMYRCATRIRLHCRGQVRVEGNRVHVIQPHNTHGSNPYIVLEARMRAEIIRQCRETMRPMVDIYREVAFRYERPVLDVVTLRSLRSSMERERYRVIPEIPLNLVTLGDFLRDYPLTQPIYRGTATGTDGISALVLANDSMIERLNNAAEIFISCTLNINAGQTRTFRMVIVYARVIETVLPMIYIFFKENSKPQFLAVWRRLITLSPGLEQNLRTAICPYESVVMNSVLEIFPRIYVTGSWHFFCVALCRKWVELRLATTPQNALWMAVSLPLAPVARFAEGLECIVNAGDLQANEHPTILQFCRYLRTKWLPVADSVSVSRESLLTNDLCVAFHQHILHKLGGTNRHLWSFFDKVNSLMESTENQWRGAAAYARSRSDLREESRIHRIQDQLSLGRLNMEEFLSGIADHRRRAQISAIVLSGVQDVNSNSGVLQEPVVEVPNVPPLVAGQADEEESDDDVIERDPNDPTGHPDFGLPPPDIDVIEPQRNGEQEGNPDVLLVDLELEVPPPVIDLVIEDNGRTGEGAGVEEDPPNGPVVFQQRACSACLGERPYILYQPCGHLAMCASCDLLMTSRTCPLCRSLITSTTKEFYA